MSTLRRSNGICIATCPRYKCLLVCAFWFDHLYTRCMQGGQAVTALVLHMWRDNAISCATLTAFIMSFSGSELLSLCFLAQQGAQPWTGPLAVAWQVILPNRICILAVAVLGMEAEYMEANCAYTDIAQAQPFRTPVDDRVAHKLSIWKELVLVAKKNVQGQSILQCLS